MDSESAFVVFFLLLLVLAVGWGYLNFRRSEELRANGKRVWGVVVRNNFHLRRSSFFLPVVRFTTQAGIVVEMEYTKGIAMAFPRFAKGTPVWVAYDEHNPQDFLVLTSGRYD